MIRAVLLSTLLLSTVSAAVARQAPPDAALSGAASGGTGAAQPMVVTSDTDAYCESLSRQISRHGDALPHPVALLRDQGQHLCAIGQVRGGINRLRRALMALRSSDDGGDADGDDNR